LSVFVDDRRRGPRLAGKALACRAQHGQMGPKNLEGHVPVERRLERLEDDPHRAGANHARHFVDSQPPQHSRIFGRDQKGQPIGDQQGIRGGQPIGDRQWVRHMLRLGVTRLAGTGQVGGRQELLHASQPGRPSRALFQGGPARGAAVEMVDERGVFRQR
jgi:hypothetical protein